MMGRGYFGSYYGGWGPYVSVAERRRKAEKKLAELKKKGQNCKPVVLAGRTIVKSFWGRAWCTNLESFSDFENRLPRGRSYVRNGAVIDLQIDEGRVTALVSGSDLYRVQIDVKVLDPKKWKAIVKACSGQIASMIELLQGRFSGVVMESVTRPREGLLPEPKDIGLNCSCPDYATMCKHVAAVLYGVGARLDQEPELLFRLRRVDPSALTSLAGSIDAIVRADAEDADHLEGADLSAVFGIDLDSDADEVKAAPVLNQRGRPKKVADSNPPAAKARGSVKPPVRKSTKTQLGSKAAVKATTVNKRGATITASELITRGVPRHMIQSWLEAKVLSRTKQRGVYRKTRQTDARVEAYLARRRASW